MQATNDSNRIVRWLIIVALTAATACIFLISMRANYLYGHSIGQSPETREAFAWANVGADVWKALGLIVVTALWRGGWRRAAITTAITWFVCLLFSVTSAIGIYVQERTALTGGREAAHTSYDDARKEFVTVEGKLKHLAPHRSAGEIEAAITDVLARPIKVGGRVRGTVASLSETCSRDDRRTAVECAEIATLRRELAVAVESSRLEDRATALRQHIGKLRGEGASIAPDPVGEFWAWLSRGWLTVRAIGFGLPLFFALMIEAVSTFGPLAILAYAEATRRAPSQTATRPVATGRDLSRSIAVERGDATPLAPETGPVVQFMADRTEPTTDTIATSIEPLYADYEDWCGALALHALSREAFANGFDRVRELPALAGKIRKVGRRYYGICLRGREVGALPVRERRTKKLGS